jgi:hypothetical protein
MSIAQDPIKCGICGKPITLEGVKVSAEGTPVRMNNAWLLRSG